MVSGIVSIMVCDSGVKKNCYYILSELDFSMVKIWGRNMKDTIMVFDTGELEIALVTYNRCDFVAEWMKRCYESIRRRNIHLSIYDSSTNRDTERYVNEWKARMNDNRIEYYHVDSGINIGYKPMLPILNAKSKYLWISGDSRCHDFECLDEKVFPYLRQDIDCVLFHILNNEENDGKIYTDKNELLRDCFVSMTCIGLSIYKLSLFDSLKKDKQFMEICNQKYRNNYGFAWIGYFLEMFAIGKRKALFSLVPGTDLKADIKIPSWFKRCYACWVDDLCGLMDAVSEKYQQTETVMRETWKYISLDSPGFCDFARRKGDLNLSTYRKYKENGMLDRVTDKADRLERFVNAADDELEQCFEQEVCIEKREFEELCNQNMDEIKRGSKGKKIWIYGAGKGGRILSDCLKRNGICPDGFLDEKAEILKECNGKPVQLVEEIETNNCYIIISLFHFAPYIIKPLLEHGIDRKDIFYMCIRH